MVRRSDVMWGGLVLALVMLAAAALRPLPDVQAAGGRAETEMAETGPMATDWIARLTARTGVAERPTRRRETVGPSLDGYQLLGLIETDGRQWALISIGGQTQTVQVGAVMEGYELVQIRADRVVFARNGEETVLWLEP